MGGGFDKRWLLPDGAQETLPPDAQAVEALRRELLTLFDRWGYDLVMPAMIEYMDSLLTGTAHALDTRTFALVDQYSGRQMGVRSDMTPQAARIDAHLLADDARHHRVSRLCYCGHLLHAIGDGINATRTPLQIGAELFGADAIGADIEVASLMVATLRAAGLREVSLDLGHVGIFRALVAETPLADEQENRLFDMLQRKSLPDLEAYLAQLPLTGRERERFLQLALLHGDSEVIDEARAAFGDAPDGLFRALDALHDVARALARLYPDTPIHCDLSELRGYNYHTGLVFAAFLPGQGHEIARGGRYDDIGRVFGNARPATGFSTDLLDLYQLRGAPAEPRQGILAPDDDDAGLAARIAEWRAAGERVVVDLSGGGSGARDQQCDRVAVRDAAGDWVIEEA